MNNYYDRFAILRFPLIVLVVYLHAGDMPFSRDELSNVAPGWFLYVKDIVSDGLARSAVPLFFLISGFLLFFNFDGSFKSYQLKIKSRIKTLLIPYFFWNLSVLVAFAIGQSLDFTSRFFTGHIGMIADFGVFDYLNAFLGLDGYPISYQFWFIRDLMILVLCSWVIGKFVNIYLCIALLIAILVSSDPDGTSWLSSFFYFYLGGLFAKEPSMLNKIRKLFFLILPVYASLLVVLILGYTFILIDLRSLVVLLGVVLFVTWAINKKRDRTFDSLMAFGGYSFFVFAVHEPTLTVLKKLIYFVSAGSEGLMVAYFFAPVAAIGIGVGSYLVLRRLAPGFLATISGGR